METILAFGAPFLGILVAVLLLFLLFVLKAFIYIGRPNEVLVFSGKKQKMADGSETGIREIRGEWAFQTPYFESMVGRMDLRTIPVNINVQGAYSKGGIPLNVHAIANVKVSSQPVGLKNAIERFLGRDPDEIRRVAKETLEGHLRGVLATLTPEEVNEDRLKFANALVEEAEADFLKLGLTLDTLKILNVSDDVRYLDSIGRERIANVSSATRRSPRPRRAPTPKQVEASAQSNAARSRTSRPETVDPARERAPPAQGRARGGGEVRGRAGARRRRAGARRSRARAPGDPTEARDTCRRRADRVLPAEAHQRAEEFRRADSRDDRGERRAMADVLQMMTDTWVRPAPTRRTSSSSSSSRPWCRPSPIA